MKRVFKRGISFIMALLMMVMVSEFWTIPAEAAGVGDAVYFGRYLQERVTDEGELEILSTQEFEDGHLYLDNAHYVRSNVLGIGTVYYKETAIEWQIIDDDGGYYTLMSSKALAVRSFGWMDCWDNCGLRLWLNEDFYKEAFNYDERDAIATTEVVTTKVPFYAPGAPSQGEPYDVVTNDKVYILSTDELTEYGLNDDASRVAKATAYVDMNEGACTWWLRGTGRWNVGNFQEPYIKADGALTYWYQTYSYGVRPVIRVSKSSECLSYTEPDYTIGSEYMHTGVDYAKLVSDAFTNSNRNNYNTTLLADAVYGPTFTFAGDPTPLFKFDFKIESPFLFNKSDFTIKHDEENHTLQVLVGYDDKWKKDMSGTTAKSKKWKNVWDETKALVLGVESGNWEMEYENEFGGDSVMDKFQKIKKNLKKKRTSLVYSADLNVVGYFEFGLEDANGDGTPEITGLNEGGVMFDGSIGAKYRHYIWTIVYAEFAGKANVEAKVFGAMVDGSVRPNFEMEIKITPSFAVGANAIVADVQGGIKGDIIGDVKVGYTKADNGFTAKLKGALFANINTIIGLNFKYEKEFKNYMELYPDFGEKKENKAVSLAYEEDQPLTARDFYALSAASQDLIDDSIIESVVDDFANPKTLKLADGSVLLTYISDKNEASKGQQALMYRVNKNGIWSDEKAVYLTDHMDTVADMYLYNDEAYIIYQRSNETITENTSVEDAASSMELYVAKYQEAENSFTTPVLISAENDTYKYDFQLCEIAGKLTAMWAENSNKDPLLTGGSTKVYTATLADGAWGSAVEYKSFNSVLDAQEYGTFGFSDTYVYQTGDRFYIGNNSFSFNKYINENVGELQLVDGRCYYTKQDNELRYINAVNLSATLTGITVSSGYIVDGNGVYWREADGLKNNIWYQSFDERCRPIQITFEDGYINSFDLCEINGKKTLIYTLQTVDEHSDEIYGATVLKSTDDFDTCSVGNVNLAYDALSYEAGAENEFLVEATNTGTIDLNNVTATFTDEEGKVIASQVLCEKLRSGMSLEENVVIKTPENFVDKYLIVTISADEEVVGENKASVGILKNDLNLTVEAVDKFNVTIKNTGDTDAKNVAVNIFHRNGAGDLIGTEEIGTLKAGESKKININKYYNMVPITSSTSSYDLYLIASGDGTELDLSDNDLSVSKEYGESLLGDVNGDGNINAADALSVLKHAAKVEELYGAAITASDVDGNDVINASDALYILRYAARIINKFPSQE